MGRIRLFDQYEKNKYHLLNNIRQLPESGILNLFQLFEGPLDNLQNPFKGADVQGRKSRVI